MGLTMFEGAGSESGVAVAAAQRGLPSGAGSRHTAPLARAGAYVSLAGMILGFIGILLPHPAQFNVPALLGAQLFTFVSSIGLIVFANRVPIWMIRSGPILGTLQASASVIFSGDPTSAYALFYLWPCFYAFYFLSRADAVFNVIFMAVCYAGAISITASGAALESTASENLTHHFVLLAGTMTIAGAMMHILRTRADGLWTQLLGAARTDLLTGLLNSAGASDALDTEIDRSRMNASRVGLLVIEVSGIREIGSRYGHDAADDILREISRLFDESTRRIDTVSRTGVSQFTILLPETDEHTGFLLGEQILARLRRTYRERSLAITASIGVASFPKHGARADALLEAASSAAEVAGTLGSDRTVVFSTELEGITPATQTVGEKRTHLSTVLSLAEVLDLRDTRFSSHSAAVARYCEMIAIELGLPEQRVQRLRMAGTLHDIGKVGIADSILDKPGPLSPGEWDEVRKHPEMAARILGARELTDIRSWIYARHEQLDGHGYPRGVSAEEIPLESRILAVAESYDAMTNDRPYRPARTQDETIDELGRYSGSQFDGAVVDALLRALDRAWVKPASV